DVLAAGCARRIAETRTAASVRSTRRFRNHAVGSDLELDERLLQREPAGLDRFILSIRDDERRADGDGDVTAGLRNLMFVPAPERPERGRLGVDRYDREPGAAGEPRGAASGHARGA